MTDDRTFAGCTYEQFRGAAAEFFRATHDRAAVTHEQAENGFHCLSLMYMGGSNWPQHEIESAVVILKLAMKRCMEVCFANALTEDE